MNPYSLAIILMLFGYVIAWVVYKVTGDHAKAGWIAAAVTVLVPLACGVSSS